MTAVEWARPAIEDLAGIVAYVTRDSAAHADALARRIILAAEKLPLFPKRGRIVPEAGNALIREILTPPYRIIYRLRKETVQIIAVVHSARELARLKLKPWETKY